VLQKTNENLPPLTIVDVVKDIAYVEGSLVKLYMFCKIVLII